MTVERILVGVDGSDNGQRALAWAIELATALGAEVVAVHALGLMARAGAGEHVPSESHRDEIIDLFEHTWCKPLDDSGVPSRRVLHDGNPVQVTLAVAAELDVDLVVLGSRGVGGYPEQLLGSTSHMVAERSDRPVVIIPPQHRLVPLP